MDFGPDYFRDVPLKGLGVGVNPADFHPAYLADGAVDFFEITAPSSRHRGPAPYLRAHERAEREAAGFRRRGVRELAGAATVLVHSTNVNPVYAQPPTEDDLTELRELLTIADAPWVTEDLGVWLMSERHVYPHFMPLPLTAETLVVATANIRFVQEVLGRPFNAEFPPMTYVAGDMHAFDFFARLCEATGCGMCVDVGHVLSYQVARGASPTADLHRLPWDSVTEIHFAGGRIDLVREGFVYHDDHGDHDVVSVCLDLIDEVVETAPHLRAIALELFGARRPERALQRLAAVRSRPSVASWLAGVVPARPPLPDLTSSRARVRSLSVGLFDVLHSDRPLSGERLVHAGPDLADVFAVNERRRWDYDRRSRLLALGTGIAAYYPATAGWIQRLRGWSVERLHDRLIATLDGTAPLSAATAARAMRSLLPDTPLLQELLDCESWMNACVADEPVAPERHWGVDIDAAIEGLSEVDGSPEGFRAKVTLAYLGDGRFGRSGGVVAVQADETGPVECGSARCCTGD
ncbi:hypothetical protein Val02_22870 [Virgisporangium aliadipatigenens]|uniref:DUF692 family protein n=1 Tax=Virgisporangium aliadipatigenens TaxID=741659 RepID=A0A8J4DPY7_9ACTN|nr:DUF692 family multinuclear iron-containing protein [Virgisporangium aliadipatigenens]GIJ45401.1 hypothetical protein Val02_22870 [Virgisporangium aliadipatigenens]